MSSLTNRSGPSVGLRLTFGLVLVLLVAAVLLPNPPGNRSSRDRGSAGSAALAGTLERMGLSVQSMRVGLRSLRDQPTGSVLIVVLAAGPLQSPAFSSRELRWVLEFVERGSTLLIAADRDHPLLDELDVAFEERAREGSRNRYAATAVLPGPHSMYGSLSLAGRGGLELSESSFAAMYSVAGQAVLARSMLGSGEVVVVADPFTLSNEGLSEGANLDLYTGLISSSVGEHGVVLFDDLHAGAPADRGIVAYARRSGFLPTLLLALMLVLLYLWRAGSRLGSVLPALDRRSGLASAQMVSAVGSLYERAGLAGHALEVLATRLSEEVELRSGVPLADAAASGGARELGNEVVDELSGLHDGLAQLSLKEAPGVDEVLRWARRSQQFQRRWMARETLQENESAMDATTGERPGSRS